MKRPEMLNKQTRDPFYGCLSLLSFLLLLVLVILMLLFNRNFFLVQVRGNSMRDTLQNTDILYAESTQYVRPERGDIVILDVTDNEMYKNTEKNEDGRVLIIKRLIALEGDTVKCEHGVVYLRRAGEEEFTAEADARIHYKTPDFSEYTLKEGEVFVLGDHRDNSLDSQELQEEIDHGENARHLRYNEITGVVPQWVVEHIGLIEKLEGFRSFIFNK